MNEHMDEAVLWEGREIFDVGGQKIGTVVGRGYPRKRFGVTWLLVRTDADWTTILPAEQVQCSGERLVLPYALSYVEGGLTVEVDKPLTPAEERRLRLHYGVDSGMPGGGCRVGCGLCMANRRELRRSCK